MSNLDPNIIIWSYPKGEYIATLQGHTQPAVNFKVIESNETMISLSKNCEVIVWDLLTANQKFRNQAP